MNFKQFLRWAEANATSLAQKGNWFERAVKFWVRSDSRFNQRLKNVWLWNEFPGRGSMGTKDLGTDLVLEMNSESGGSEFWAVQCKFYSPKAVLPKSSLDSFIAHSAGKFTIEGATFTFSKRLYSTGRKTVGSDLMTISSAESGLQSGEAEMSAKIAAHA